MKQFIAGFLLASGLAAGWAWAQQSGIITDRTGQVQGYLLERPHMNQPDFMAPSRQMQQQLNQIIQDARPPC